MSLSESLPIGALFSVRGSTNKVLRPGFWLPIAFSRRMAQKLRRMCERSAVSDGKLVLPQYLQLYLSGVSMAPCYRFVSGFEGKDGLSLAQKRDGFGKEFGSLCDKNGVHQTNLAQSPTKSDAIGQNICFWLGIVMNC